MNYQEKAEQYVREKLPELMELSFGCEVKGIGKDKYFIVQYISSNSSVDTYCVEDDTTYNLYEEEYKIIGHPIQLQHWLRVFEAISTRFHYYLNLDGELIKLVGDKLEIPTHAMWFNLTTGQPATEADYQAFCEIVGI